MLAAVCGASAIVAVLMLAHPRVPRSYTVLLLLISVWSVAFGWGMLVIAFDWWPSPGVAEDQILEALNTGASLAVGLWAFFGWRVWQELGNE